MKRKENIDIDILSIHIYMCFVNTVRKRSSADSDTSTESSHYSSEEVEVHPNEPTISKETVHKYNKSRTRLNHF